MGSMSNRGTKLIKSQTTNLYLLLYRQNREFNVKIETGMEKKTNTPTTIIEGDKQVR